MRVKAVTGLAVLALFGGACGGAPQAPQQPVQAEVHVGRDAAPPLVAAGAVWVANEADGTVSRIDPKANKVVATILIGDPQVMVAAGCGPGSVHSFMYFTLLNRRCDIPSSLTWDGRSVWAADNVAPGLDRIDPGTNRVVQRIALDADPFDLAWGYGSLWVSSYFHEPRELLRVDPATGQVLATITDVTLGATGLAVGDGAVWVASTYGNLVARIDPATNRVIATIPVEQYPLAVTVGSGAVWVRNEESSSVSRIDPATNRVVATIRGIFMSDGRTGEDAMALTPQGLWTASVQLLRVDTAHNRIAAKIDASGGGVSAGFGSLWLTSVVGTVQRIDPRSATATSSGT
jgi:YVTN family beta-propeller protein